MGVKSNYRIHSIKRPCPNKRPSPLFAIKRCVFPVGFDATLPFPSPNFGQTSNLCITLSTAKVVC